MINNFKIYVPVLDEERLIPYTIEALLKVFDPKQIVVLDLGSIDQTLNRIPNGVIVHNIELPKDKNNGAFFTEIKNTYAKRQKYVLFVDGDEIYPTSSLLKVKEWVELGLRGEHNRVGVRVYWKILKELNGNLECSREYLSAGPKLFDSTKLKFKRAWPDEVTVNTDVDAIPQGHKSEFNGVWFWHGVLLERSSIKERTARYKKRLSKVAKYNMYLTWDSIERFPWEDNYVGHIDFPWIVSNMSHSEGGYRKKWSGNHLRGVV